MKYIRFFMLAVSLLLLGGCSTFGFKVGDMAKIKFDLNEINKDGLKGKGSELNNDLRSVDYEFCMPANIEYVDEVMAIDQSLVVYQQASGRVGCTRDQYLGVGNTAQNDYREVLRKLAELEYVESIHEAFFE